MAYKVRLTLLWGQTTDRTDLQTGPTPKIGDRIMVHYARKISRARVTAVRIIDGPEAIHEVDAQEF